MYREKRKMFTFRRLGTGISLALVATLAGMVIQCLSSVSCGDSNGGIVDSMLTELGIKDMGSDAKAAGIRYGISTLAATTNINSTSICQTTAAPTDILNTSLPDTNAAYVVTAHVSGKLECNSGMGWIHTEIWDGSSNTMIKESEQILFAVQYSTQMPTYVGSGSTSILFSTTSAGQKILLKACYSCSGTMKSASILSSVNGRTKLVYQRVN